MKLRFVKVNPVENMTLFVLDPVPREEQMNVANKLMKYSNIHGEQVGFIEREGSYIRLQMMGGEFCGNASRSLAAWMVYNEYPTVERMDEGYKVKLKVSGVEGIIECVVLPTDKRNSFWSTVHMPLPLAVEENSIEYGGSLVKTIRVDFPGITHFIVDGKGIEDKEKFYNKLKWEMDQDEYEAFGIMYYDYEKNFLTPLVYVKATDSLYWERSCASGTSALGAALAFEKNTPLSKNVSQPGRNLEVLVDWTKDSLSNIGLKGLVDIVAEGTVYI
ncbi:diaminopimelate epimerase [Schnuerera ultunensis]|uniref:diaminopimelate epimerase n=1 Tax=Schnuerera ultunensis TaxID=45497 RepID=UPI00041953C1|nr:diaminopimelate epimerase [Schnuerera ultunensis]